MKPFIIILAAGKSTRFKTDKMFAVLDGRPLFLHSVMRYQSETDTLVLVVPPEEQEAFEKACLSNGVHTDGIHFVEGGATRTESVTNALNYLKKNHSPDDADTRLVAIHDAARPFASVSLLKRLCDTASRIGGAVPGSRVVDTLLLSDGQDTVRHAVPRDNLWRVSTPQVFRFNALLEAYARLCAPGAPPVSMTDDSQVFIANGGCIKLVEEDADNMKITFPEDLKRAEWLLKINGSVSNQS